MNKETLFKKVKIATPHLMNHINIKNFKKKNVKNLIMNLKFFISSTMNFYYLTRRGDTYNISI